MVNSMMAMCLTHKEVYVYAQITEVRRIQLSCNNNKEQQQGEIKYQGLA